MHKGKNGEKKGGHGRIGDSFLAWLWRLRISIIEHNTSTFMVGWVKAMFCYSYFVNEVNARACEISMVLFGYKVAK
jgi:hypothetical protein